MISAAQTLFDWGTHRTQQVGINRMLCELLADVRLAIHRMDIHQLIRVETRT